MVKIERGKVADRLNVLGAVGTVELPPVVRETGLAGEREASSDMPNL